MFVSNFTTAHRRHVFGELGVATPLLKTFMNHSAECKVNASFVLDGFIQAKRVCTMIAAYSITEPKIFSALL